MIKKFSIALLVISSVYLFSATSLADFYRFTDEDGVMHITNVPTSAKYRWMMKETPRPRIRYKGPQKEFDHLIRSASTKYGVDPHLVKAIVKAESDFDSDAVSEKGAKGLMQLMPETSRAMGVKDANDPRDNVEGGIKYLSKLLKLFDWQVPLAVAAYNAGENAVIKYGSVPPYAETQTYVKRVLRYYEAYKDSEK